MDYHVNHNGQNLGKIPLDELQRRRAAGALSGEELVWRPGMVNWQRLDDVLRQPVTTAMPPPVPPSARSKDHSVLLIVCCVLGFLAFVGIVGGLAVKRAIQQARVVIQSSQRYGNPDGLTAASQPVVVSSNAFTAMQALDRGREFRIRQYVDGYKLRGDRNPATDALALGLVQNWVAGNYNGTVDTNLPSLPELSDRLASDPNCTDPLVLTVAAVNSAETHELVGILERAVKGFAHSKHLGYPKLFATVTLENELYKDREMRLPSLDATAMGYFEAAMTDGSLQPKDQPELADILLNGWGEQFFYRNAYQIIDLIKQKGDRFSWLALVLQGQLEINGAWRARGGGYAGSVTGTGWSGFNKHLSNARGYLTTAWQKHPEWPMAPCQMIYVSLGDSGIGEMRKWFDRTTAAQFDYASAWSQLRWGLRPRWYGSEDAILALGLNGLNTRRFDTYVPYEYFNSVADVESDTGVQSGDHIYGRSDIWPHLQDMYEGYIAVTQNDAQRRWRSAYAIVAHLAGKEDIARQQLEALNWQLNHYNLTGWSRDLSLVADEVAARTSPLGPQIGEAEICRHANDYISALKIYRSLNVSNLNTPAQNFVKERLASLDIEQRLHNGGWVDFLPVTTNLTGWQVERGQCKVLSDGALEVHSDENGHLLYSRVRVGTEFEVRGQFELVHSTDDQFQGGLVMGVPQFETQDWYAFRMKQSRADGAVASFSRTWSMRQEMVPATINTTTNIFWFRYVDGKITAEVNGREVFHEIDPPKYTYVTTNEFLLGLGAFNNTDATVVRYRNLQVHLLTL